MNNKQDILIYLDCKVGGVVPVTAEIQLDKFNYISKNIVDKTAKIVKDEEDMMYPHIDNEIGILEGLRFTVKNSKGEEKVVGHKDNYFYIISEPDILILGTPWLWLLDVTINLRNEYLMFYHHLDKFKIHSTYPWKITNKTSGNFPK